MFCVDVSIVFLVVISAARSAVVRCVACTEVPFMVIDFTSAVTVMNVFRLKLRIVHRRQIVSFVCDISVFVIDAKHSLFLTLVFRRLSAVCGIFYVVQFYAFLDSIESNIAESQYIRKEVCTCDKITLFIMHTKKYKYISTLHNKYLWRLC